MNGLKPVQALGHENEVRMQSGDLLEAGIDRAADFGFFLGIGRVITIVGVTDEASVVAEVAAGDADCAHKCAAADSRTAIAKQTANRKRGCATSFKKSPGSEISDAQQKSPTRHTGALRQRSF